MREPGRTFATVRQTRHRMCPRRLVTAALPFYSISKEAIPMPYCHLRVYHGPDEAVSNAWVDQRPSGKRCVTLPMGDVLPLLADATEARRTWLSDFEDDEVTISTDLYEVLLSYQHFRRPSA